MSYYGVEKPYAFSEEERQHIKILFERKKVLHKQKLKMHISNRETSELKALEWFMSFLNEVSEE